MLTRRNFLGTTGLAAGAALIPARALAHGNALAIPPGLQLWTVKEELAKDLPGTLKALSALGYKRVESAGWVGRTPAEFAAAVRDAGLECTSCHFGMRDLMTDADTDKHIAETKEIGAAYIVASSPNMTRPIPEGMPWGKGVAASMTLADWQANAERMNIVGAKAKAAGLKFGYHNHAAEFLMYDGKLAWGELLRITDPELVVFEVDLGWVAAAGVDPVDGLKLTGNRTHLLHVKDLASKEPRVPNKLFEDETTTPIGKGTLDWPAIFAQANHAPIHSWFVEQEAPFVQPPLEGLAESIAYLKTLKAA